MRPVPPQFEGPVKGSSDAEHTELADGRALRRIKKNRMIPL
jgi:hypothetical protein